jgi:hypothetical protein
VHHNTLSLAAAALVLCAWMPVQAKDDATAPRTCVGIAGPSARATGIMKVSATLPVERASVTNKVNTKARARSGKPDKALDSAREIWRHHGVG